MFVDHINVGVVLTSVLLNTMNIDEYLSDDDDIVITLGEILRTPSMLKWR